MYFKYLGILFGFFMAFYHFFLSHFLPGFLSLLFKYLDRPKPLRNGDEGDSEDPENE